MADLLSSLISPKSSQDSFHSTQSQQGPSTTAPTTNFPHGQRVDQSDTPETTAYSNNHQQGLDIHDINAYLSRPESVALLSQAKQPSRANQPAATTSLHTALPDLAETTSSPKSALALSHFFELCQSKGITPHFDIIDAPGNLQKFTGTLTIGTQNILLERPEPSKKDVRAALAEKAYPLLETMQANVKRKAGDDGTANPNSSGDSISKLLDFHKLSCPPDTPGPTFTFTTAGPAFICTCTIAQSPQPFQSPFCGSKKLAKASVAQLAVEYLVREGHLDPDGGIKKRQKAKLGAGIKVATGPDGAKDEGEKSWGQKVNELFPLLGFPNPVYRLEVVDPRVPNVYSGGVLFEGVGGTQGLVGEVWNVFGKKKAREECARGAWEFLEKVRRERVKGFEGMVREGGGVGEGKEVESLI